MECLWVRAGICKLNVRQSHRGEAEIKERLRAALETCRCMDSTFLSTSFVEHYY